VFVGVCVCGACCVCDGVCSCVIENSKGSVSDIDGVCACVDDDSVCACDDSCICDKVFANDSSRTFFSSENVSGGPKRFPQNPVLPRDHAKSKPSQHLPFFLNAYLPSWGSFVFS